MNLRDYIATIGGHIGIITFLLSIIIYLTGNMEVAITVDAITLFTLNPYHTYQAYYETKSDYYRLSPLWLGKFGSLISLISIVNLFWFSFLVYANSNSLLISFFSFLFIILILPKILIKLMIVEDE